MVEASSTFAVRFPGFSDVVPDLRAERRPHQVMSEAGWRHYERLLGDCEPGGHVFVMSSVPAMGPRLSLVEALLGLVPRNPLIALLFVVLGGAFMGALGLFAGIFSNKFDQMAAITNFIVTPLAFLSGTFYSVEALPPVLNRLSHVNPVFYLIDGLRNGMIGVSDSSPALGFAVCSGATLIVCAITWQMLRKGYRLKA